MCARKTCVALPGILPGWTKTWQGKPRHKAFPCFAARAYALSFEAPRPIPRSRAFSLPSRASAPRVLSPVPATFHLLQLHSPRRSSRRDPGLSESARSVLRGGALAYWPD